ncbi:MAG: prolipoprotein diacylglyceryl transferase [Eubacteriales bacterium]|nr:prolipoprotein diacylglyceryl transferase [Eubacteriales bacterium]MDD3350356.1 prolipoprotein diacylglyceryl transferase [Eubacteriales bacterium]
MILPTPDPIAFTILDISIRWYGVCIAFGMLLGLLVTYIRAPLHDIQRERVIDLVLICIPSGILGARLYYVLFNWEFYQGDFFAMINIRSGGLAIHGGLLLGILAAIIAAKAFEINPLNLLDLAAPGIVLAQAIGRWGNYFNQEAHGGPTNLPWAIEVDGQMVHPTFLYESVWCFVLFLVLLIVDHRGRFHGQTFLLYGMLYSIERFFVEALRTDSLMIGMFRTAQVVSLLIFIVFLFAYVLLGRRQKRNNRMFY